jgi:hypothetical protein
MKKILLKSMLLPVTIFFIGGIASAQGYNAQKTDKVIFLNGETKEGKVIELTTEKIQFAYRGETHSYEFNKREIEKIEYASGRTELITEKRIPEISLTLNPRNRVAVMPMTYIGDGNDERTEEMRYQLQDITISCLSKTAAELKYLDAAEINALLYKNGVTDQNIRQYTPKELAGILHVEYIIMGSVIQDKGNLVTISNSQTTRRQIIDHRHHHHHDDVRIARRNNRHSSSVTKQNIETKVSLSIYNETGEKIYTKSRQSILSEADAYRNAIQYLLKRTSLYNR